MRLDELKKQLAEQEEKNRELTAEIQKLSAIEGRIEELEKKAHVHKILR